jgi:hypothetical protein
VSTGHGASCSTASVTDPRSSRLNPRWPWVPRTMRSAPSDKAWSTIVVGASPSSATRVGVSRAAVRSTARRIRSNCTGSNVGATCSTVNGAPYQSATLSRPYLIDCKQVAGWFGGSLMCSLSMCESKSNDTQSHSCRTQSYRRPRPRFRARARAGKTSGAELYLLHLSQRASFTIAGPGWCLSIGVSCSARLVCG